MLAQGGSGRLHQLDTGQHAVGAFVQVGSCKVAVGQRHGQHHIPAVGVAGVDGEPGFTPGQHSLDIPCFLQQDQHTCAGQGNWQ